MSEIESKTEIENANDEYTSSLSVVKFLNLMVNCQKSLLEIEKLISQTSGIENDSLITIIKNRGKWVRDESTKKKRRNMEDPGMVYTEIRSESIFDTTSKFSMDYRYGFHFMEDNWIAWRSVSVFVTDMTPIGDPCSIILKSEHCSEKNLTDMEKFVQKWLESDLKFARTFNPVNPLEKTYLSSIYPRVHDLIVSIKWNEADEGDHFRRAIYEKSPEEYKRFDEALNSIRHEASALRRQREAKES
jgi:hypothetical protein